LNESSFASYDNRTLAIQQITNLRYEARNMRPREGTQQHAAYRHSPGCRPRALTRRYPVLNRALRD